MVTVYQLQAMERLLGKLFDKWAAVDAAAQGRAGPSKALKMGCRRAVKMLNREIGAVKNPHLDFGNHTDTIAEIETLIRWAEEQSSNDADAEVNKTINGLRMAIKLVSESASQRERDR